MQDIFSELSKGNDKPFIEAMGEDMQWTWMGTGQWSKTFKGKSSVLDELWAAVKSTINQPFTVVAHRFIADGDYVVVEASGQNTTPEGKHTIISTVGYAVISTVGYAVLRKAGCKS